jgi:hypothetical protein
MIRVLLSISLIYSLNLNVTANSSVATKSQVRTASNLSQLADGDYHFYLVQNSFLTFSSKQLSAEFTKQGNIIKGGFKYATISADEMSAPRTICFAGVVKGNLLTTTRAIELDDDSMIGVLKEFPKIDLTGAGITALKPNQADTGIQTCAAIHYLYDGIQSVYIDTDEFINEAGRIVNSSSVGSAANMSRDFVNMEIVRKWYLAQTTKAVDEIHRLITSHAISLEEGATRVYRLRDTLRELARARDSAYGQALARAADKPSTFAMLKDKRAAELFGKGTRFAQLDIERQAAVLWAVVKGAGRISEDFTNKAAGFGIAGKVLLGLTLAVSIYTIGRATDKVQAAQQEGASIAGGTAGWVASGWVGRTIFCGVFAPEVAPACVLVSAFVGSVLGSIGGRAFLDELNREPEP